MNRRIPNGTYSGVGRRQTNFFYFRDFSNLVLFLERCNIAKNLTEESQKLLDLSESINSLVKEYRL
ncbi:hypothetical protein [Petrotoga sp. DB-2]